MLTSSIDAYLALRRALGFRLEDEAALLRAFAAWATERGATYVRAPDAVTWATAARSPWRREKRLRVVAAFARHAAAEDPRHEVPPTHVFRHTIARATPHIYAPEEVRRLLAAAADLPPVWPLRPHVVATLFGLLAATGLRVSEALALRLDDITPDGLVIRKTKFNKTRLVPLHASTAAALDHYLTLRRGAGILGDHVLVSRRGRRVARQTASLWFYRLARHLGLRGGPGTRGPRIHDLRHTFAVRALEAAPARGATIGRHVRALSTYLGHAGVAQTCWYLHTTPQLMRGVADACEQFLDRGAR
jgi:integrase